MLPIVGGKDLPPIIDPETNLKKYAAIGGYPVLDAIMKADPKDYQKLLMTKSVDMPIWIGSVKFTDTLDDVLDVFAKTKSGNVVVEGEGDARTLLSLKDIVALFETGKLRTDLRAFDVGSKKISISNDSSIQDALRAMFKERIRRVFSSSRRSDRLRFVSSRDIISFLFSPERLELLRQEPEMWIQERISSVPSSDAKFIPDSTEVNEASREMGWKEDACLVCNESDKVVTRWDVVMKPWKLGELQNYP